MTLHDWRVLPPGVVEPLLAAEIDAWARDLHWDVRQSWAVVEPARRAGRLPGRVVMDSSGRPQGWTCFFADGRSIQVMAIVATSAAATARLVESLMTSPQADTAETISCFVRGNAPGLDACLRAMGFQVGEYRYLVRESAPCPDQTTSGPAGRPHTIRRWSAGSSAHGGAVAYQDVASLLERAYAASPELRAFAPHGTSDEWHDYLENLLDRIDCGRFLPEASYVATGPEALDGVVITTRLDETTAHIAQLAVDPSARARGIGRALLDAALGAAAACQLPRTSLLVSDANARALALYAGQGFVQRASFVAARLAHPRRLTSVALATGGASTRR